MEITSELVNDGGDDVLLLSRLFNKLPRAEENTFGASCRASSPSSSSSSCPSKWRATLYAIVDFLGRSLDCSMRDECPHNDYYINLWNWLSGAMDLTRHGFLNKVECLLGNLVEDHTV